MAPLGLSALRSLLGRRTKSASWHPPEASWSRPFGLGWEQPYTVRYASNLDDGPNHGMPLGGFGAGCIGRAPDGNVNLWHLDGGEHWFGMHGQKNYFYAAILFDDLPNRFYAIQFWHGNINDDNIRL